MCMVHLFVSYAHVNLFYFFSSPGIGGWLRLLLLALPGLFCLPFWTQGHCQEVEACPRKNNSKKAYHLVKGLATEK